MFGSTILNQGPHDGLHKLVTLSKITHSSLGPHKQCKFIYDKSSGDSSLACSCLRILENLDLTCAVGQLVFETIQAHQKAYQSGSGCLLFLAGVWSGAALSCLQRGIPVPHIISAMSEGMDVCLHACRKCAISLDSLALSERSVPGPPCMSSHVQKRETCSSGGQRRINLRHSRHLCDIDSKTISTSLQQHAQKSTPDISAHLAERLSHGCVSAMKLVVESLQIQSKGHQHNVSTFDVSKVLTCMLPGIPEDNSCVLPGCVVVVSAEQASVAHKLQEQNLKVAVINADLSDTCRHPGFKKSSIQRVNFHPNLSNSSPEQEWIDTVLTFLTKLEVNLVLSSGVASKKLIQHCCRRCILVVDKIKVSVLTAFATAAGAVPVFYPTQLSQCCVGTGARVLVWKTLGSNNPQSSVAVNISTVRDWGLVTTVITSCVPSKLQALEDQFWSCAYRLHHALTDRVVLPGAGETEILCVQHLTHHAQHHAQKVAQHRKTRKRNPYTDTVLFEMAQGLMDYVCTIMVNTGKLSKVDAWTAVHQELQAVNGSKGLATRLSEMFLDCGAESAKNVNGSQPLKVYDCLCVKEQAWRKALDLVFLVMQTDAEVITDVHSKSDMIQKNVMFL